MRDAASLAHKGYSFRKIVCNICGSNSTTYIGRRVPSAFSLPDGLITQIVRCKGCGLIYPNPMPFPNEQQLKQNYGKSNGYFPASITEERMQFYNSILEGIERFVKKGKLLDVGCGRGELLYMAQKRGWQGCGVEISRNFADYARSRFGLNVRVGEIGSMRFDDEQFDAICLVSVLQHTYNPKELLFKLNRILKKDGVLFIETMNNASLVYSWGDFYYRLRGADKTTNLSPTFPSYQVYGFTAKSVSMILQVTGFKIVKMRIRGGVSSTEKVKVKNILDKSLRFIRMMVMVVANLLNKGQVLVVYARKGKE